LSFALNQLLFLFQFKGLKIQFFIQLSTIPGSFTNFFGQYRINWLDCIIGCRRFDRLYIQHS